MGRRAYALVVTVMLFLGDHWSCEQQSQQEQETTDLKPALNIHDAPRFQTADGAGHSPRVEEGGDSGPSLKGKLCKGQA